jgi:hypothetical protein
MTEIWKPIDGYHYEVSSFGNVRNIDNHILVGQRRGGGLHITLCKHGNTESCAIHRLVAQAFIPNPENKPFVDHRNGDTTNNYLENLRWATNQENQYNAKIPSTNTSGIKGVMWNKSKCKWYAQIRINGIKKHLGYFETKEEARDVRQAKARELFGEFVHSSESM